MICGKYKNLLIELTFEVTSKMPSVTENMKQGYQWVRKDTTKSYFPGHAFIHITIFIKYMKISNLEWQNFSLLTIISNQLTVQNK